jgi:hypothetical protein
MREQLLQHRERRRGLAGASAAEERDVDTSRSGRRRAGHCARTARADEPLQCLVDDHLNGRAHRLPVPCGEVVFEVGLRRNVRSAASAWRDRLGLLTGGLLVSQPGDSPVFRPRPIDVLLPTTGHDRRNPEARSQTAAHGRKVWRPLPRYGRTSRTRPIHPDRDQHVAQKPAQRLPRRPRAASRTRACCLS